MTQFKDIHGNYWAFVRTNISLIYYTPKDHRQGSLSLGFKMLVGP